MKNKKSFIERKKVPKYWWDFKAENEIIVESDCDKYPVVAKFKYDPEDGIELFGEELKTMRALGIKGNKFGAAEEAIEKAVKYIEDLNAGRITFLTIKF